MTQSKTYFILAGVLTVLVVGFGIFIAKQEADQASRQSAIHDRGSSVMSFDVSKTLHEFKKTDTGGMQRVTARDGADEQSISLIRMHLKMEADSFAKGDFVDPIMLHGSSMSGVDVLKERNQTMKVIYQNVPGGGSIVYETSDAQTKDAIHAWFDAQVSDHGSDAVEL